MESYRIVANGFALECIEEAADRIEELVRFIEEQDALLQEARPLIEHAEIVKKERDQLRKDVELLWDALAEESIANAAWNAAVEECAKVCDAKRLFGREGYFCADDIRALRVP